MTFLCLLSFPHDECIGRKLTYEAKCQWLWRKKLHGAFFHNLYPWISAIGLTRTTVSNSSPPLFLPPPLSHSHICILKFLLSSTPEGIIRNTNYQKVIKVYKQPLKMIKKTTEQKVPYREWFGFPQFVERLRKPPGRKPDLWENLRA